MNENRSTISHSVRGPGFKYDVLKGELSKESHISKATHPLPEVEAFKQRLLQRKLLKDAGTHWELRTPIRTGNLMAFNLYAGYLVKEPLYRQDIVVNQEDAKALEGKLQEKQICVTNSEIVMRSICDTLRYSSVNLMEVDSNVLTNHDSDSFGKDEEFVLKFLQERGVVSASARHGESGKNEADIVDEVSGEQFEITYEFKTALSKKHMKPDVIYSPEMLVLQLVDNPFIHPSNSLLRKLKKNYTAQYRSNLVILTFGDKQAVVSMLEALGKKMEKENICEIDFVNTYIIALDFLSEKILFCRISSTAPFYVDQFPYKNEDLGLIKITPIDFSSMANGDKYLMICDGIFDGVQRCRYDEAAELRKWAKEVRIWGITAN